MSLSDLPPDVIYLLMRDPQIFNLLIGLNKKFKNIGYNRSLKEVWLFKITLNEIINNIASDIVHLKTIQFFSFF